MITPSDSWLSALIRPLGWIAAVFCQFFPAAGFFLDHAPPFFPSLGVFVSFVGMGFLLWSYVRERHKKNRQQRAVVFTLVAILTIAAYGVALQYWTVVPPAGQEGHRRQIGFHMANWTLTEDAIEKMEELPRGDPPIEVRNPNDLMKVFGVWGERGETFEIWRLWSIVVAGTTLIVLFLVGFGFWGYCLGIWLRCLEVGVSQDNSDQ